MRRLVLMVLAAKSTFESQPLYGDERDDDTIMMWLNAQLQLVQEP